MTLRVQAPPQGSERVDGGSGCARVGSLRLRHALAAGILVALASVASSFGTLYLATGTGGMMVLAALAGILAASGAIIAWGLTARRFDALVAIAQRMRQIGNVASQGGTRPPVIDEIDAVEDALLHMLAAQAEDELRRAAAYEQIHHTGEMFAALFEHAPFGIALLHADGRFARTNDVYRKITGYTEEELGELGEPGVTAPESAAADQEARATLRQGGSCAPYEKEYLARGAIRVPVRITPFAPLDAGVNEFVWWIAEDLSVRRRLVDALKASETEARMLSAAFAHTASLVVICNADGAIEWVNQAFVDLSGYRLDEITGRKPGALLQGPQTDAATVEIMRTAIAAQRGFAVEILNYARAGRAFWLAMECAPVFDHLGRLERFVAIGRDITAQRQAEQALRESRERYQRALDGSQDGVWECDLRAGKFHFSDRFDELLGHPPGGLPRETPRWQALIHPDDIGPHLEATVQLLGAAQATMWEARVRTTSGEYRWLRFRGIAFRDAQGSAILTSGTASDIHDAKLAQLELEAHRDNLTRLVEARTRGLAQATREAEGAQAAAEAARQSALAASQSKSEFLANMSHELRTPMHAIISFASFGVDKIDRVDNAKLLHYFRNIHKSGSRLLLLLNDLLDLSKLEAGKMQMQRQMTDLRGLIDDATAEVEALARSRAIVLLVEVSGTLSAAVDPTRMLQVLRNLLSNAIKFSPDGGRVVLRCAWQPAAAGAGDAPLVELRVTDEGIGIPEDELEAVFDKFVQSSKTKTGAGGTGLGLAICREIIAAHGGTIHACNNPAPAHGATFVLRFPALVSAAAAPRVPASVC